MEVPTEPPNFRMRPAITKNKVRALYSRYKQLVNRYKRVGVIRRPPKEKNDNYEYITDERKVKNRPNYADMADEDAQEEDEEIVKEVWLDQAGEKKDDEEEAAAEAAAAAKKAQPAQAAKGTAPGGAAKKQPSKPAAKPAAKQAPKKK